MLKIYKSILYVFCFILISGAVLNLFYSNPLPRALSLVAICLAGLAFYTSHSVNLATLTYKRIRYSSYALIMIIYIMLELVFNITNDGRIMNNMFPDVNSGFGYFNGPCARFDSVRGYRWIEGDHRIVKFTNEELIYDQTFHSNNMGFYSKQNYSFKKDTNKKQKRFLILGDSFVAGEYLATPLADRLNQLSKQKCADAYEFYSFSINGGGIVNWHEIFFREIVNQYEFDGVILAVFANDLNRTFLTMHHLPNTGYAGYFDTVPHSLVDYTVHYLPRSKPYAPYMADAMIEKKKVEILADCHKPALFLPNLYGLSTILFLPVVIYQRQKVNKFIDTYIVDAHTRVSMTDIKQDIGAAHLDMLDQMLTYCKLENKKVILATIPYLPAIEAAPQREIKSSLELKAIADHFHTFYFDGITPYTSIHTDNVETYFFHRDTHWNQKGCDFYADHFIDMLNKQQ